MHSSSALCRLIYALCVFLISLILFPSFSETQISKKQLSTYEDQFLPEEDAPADTVLIGTGTGLYRLKEDGSAVSLWLGGGVKKILRVDEDLFLLSNTGVVASRDGISWEERNSGLPIKTIKLLKGREKSFLHVTQELKDLETNPSNPDILITATKDTVYLSRDRGNSWKSLGVPVRTNGIKSVAIASMPKLTAFVSHGIYGIHYLEIEEPNAKWKELNTGLERLETTNNPDEVSDMVVAKNTGVSGAANIPEIYAAQSFRGKLYTLDWSAKRFLPLWSTEAAFYTAESLSVGSTHIRFLGEDSIVQIPRPGTTSILPFPEKILSEREDLLSLVKEAGEAVKASPTALYLQNEDLSLSELWLLGGDNSSDDPRQELARGREGLYLPVNHTLDSHSLAPYLEIIDKKKQNMVVIDMKDDYGRLRFTPKNPAILEKGRVFNPVDVEALAATMKVHGVYLIARIVVFKDPELAKKEGGKYAVWDAKKNEPWVGYYETKRKLEATQENGDTEEFELIRTYYDERWVDPYSEEVWEYTAAISQELHDRGFDEIQYDYIRFPTDGINLNDASYRWKDSGMDMESAILSFLRHIRTKVDAPLSIDIYGANGWYRTGARTGQEVELLAPYVDAICPMYYPSHFEQEFLAHEPAELRPYRIYYNGTLRTSRIARNQVIVRPYVQSFYLNVSYDRKYYNADYVRRQVEGVRDAGAPGLTYWNNVGRYDEIPWPGELKTIAQELQRTLKVD